MATADLIPSEAEILAELLVPNEAGCRPRRRGILTWRFGDSQKKRMRELSERPARGH